MLLFSGIRILQTVNSYALPVTMQSVTIIDINMAHLSKKWIKIIRFLRKTLAYTLREYVKVRIPRGLKCYEN
jgi:hypothetical protein